MTSGQGDTVTRDACASREGTRWQGDTVTRGLRFKNEFLAAWEVACDAIAHEFVAEDAFAFGYVQGRSRVIYALLTTYKIT